MNLFQDKRQKVQSQLNENEALLLLSNPITNISGDTNYWYQPFPSFFYLSGIEEANCAIFLEPNHAILYVRPVDPLMELWNGKMLGIEGGKKLNFDEVIDIQKMEEDVKKRLRTKEKLYCHYLRKHEWDEVIRRVAGKQASRNHEKNFHFSDAEHLIHPLRSQKNHPEEIQAYQEMASLSARAYRDLLPKLSELKSENQVEAFFSHYLRFHGAKEFAYTPICASGANSCCLHYIENDKPLENHILIDLGFRKHLFNADITRTFPIGKRLNSLQEEVYQLVLDCNKYIIESIELGKDSLSSLKERASLFMESKMKKIPALKHSIAEYFPHGCSHSLGLEVHDCLHKEQKLEIGNYFTVEPGFYCRFVDDPKELQGFGVRIEDNVLLTKDGPENLTQEAPKELDEIYDMMRL